MKKVMIIAITKDSVISKCWNSWIKQDYENYSILLHQMKPQELSKIEGEIKHLNVALNRETARKLALSSDADYFLFVDSDIVLPLNAVSELSKQLDSMQQHAIAGYYKMMTSKRKVYPVYCMARLIADHTIFYLRRVENSVVKIDYAGLGCIMVSRELLNKIKIKVNFKTGLTVAGENRKVIFDESFDFCEQIFKKGYQLWADGLIVCEHLTGDKK